MMSVKYKREADGGYSESIATTKFLESWTTKEEEKKECLTYVTLQMS
jgi:hypothetical protein